MENNRFPEENGELFEGFPGMPEPEEESSFDLLERLPEFLAEEGTPLTAQPTSEWAPQAETLPSMDDTVVFAPVEVLPEDAYPAFPENSEDIPLPEPKESFPAAEEILETILDEEGNLNLDATLDMVLQDVEALLAPENEAKEPILPTEPRQDPVPPVAVYSDMDLDFPEPEYDRDFRETTADEEFDGMFQERAQSVVIPEPKPREPRKGRPKRKKGYGFFGLPHLLATAIWLVIIVSIGVSLGRILWLCAADVLAFGREDKAVTITIGANDTIEDIANTLHKNQLIRYPELFKLYASLAVDEGEIATGTFTLNTLYDYHAIVNGMSSYSSFREVVEDVLIPEGYNCRQIFELLQEKGICSVAELEEYAANGEFQDFWFLEDVPRGDKYCLEGYLFPDTYDFYAGSTPREALGKMLLGFEARVNREETEAQLAVLNDRLEKMMVKNGCTQDFIAENRIGLRELLIVASLIEEETASASESKNIASVIYNRLTQDQVYERYLGIDATILYALGYHTDALTKEELEIDSPYNTRIYAGLVPTPITNPGLNSLQAALDPADTDYYYYVLNPSTGMHQFSKTLAEHEAWKAEFGG